MWSILRIMCTTKDSLWTRLEGMVLLNEPYINDRTKDCKFDENDDNQ